MFAVVNEPPPPPPPPTQQHDTRRKAMNYITAASQLTSLKSNIEKDAAICASTAHNLIAAVRHGHDYTNEELIGLLAKIKNAAQRIAN